MIKRSLERKNPRAKEWNYATCGEYFVTICCAEQRCLFAPYERPDQPSEYGKIVADQIKAISSNETDVQVPDFVVMPNHVHLLVQVLRDGSNLSEVIRRFKARSARAIGGKESGAFVWQRGFHDRIVKNENQAHAFKKYIQENIGNWIIDKLG